MTNKLTKKQELLLEDIADEIMSFEEMLKEPDGTIIVCDVKKVRQVIHQALDEYRDEVIEMVEGMKIRKPWLDKLVKHYNQALEDVKNKLKGER